MIRIGKPYIRETDELAYLCADINISEETALKFQEITRGLKNTSWLTQYDYPPASWNDGSCTLWFSVEPQFAKYLCKERSNALTILKIRTSLKSLEPVMITVSVSGGQC